MRKRQALTAFAAVAMLSLPAAWRHENLPEWWSPILVAPFALLVSGLLPLLLLGPHLTSGSPRLRLTHALLCGLAFAMVVVEGPSAVPPLLDGHVTALDASRLGLHALLAATAVRVLTSAWARAPARERRHMLQAAAGFTTALLLDPLAPLVAVAIVTLHGSAFFGLAGFRRRGRDYARAAGAATAVLGAGLLALLATQGSVLPPRLVLDSTGFRGLVVPILTAATLIFGILLALGEPPASVEA